MLGKQRRSLSADVRLGEQGQGLQVFDRRDVLNPEPQTGKKVAVVRNFRHCVPQYPPQGDLLASANHLRWIKLPAAQFVLYRLRLFVLAPCPERVNQTAAGDIEQSHSSASASISAASSVTVNRARHASRATAVKAQY